MKKPAPQRFLTLLQRAMPFASILIVLVFQGLVAAQGAPGSSAMPGPPGQMHRPGSGATGYLANGELNFLQILPSYPVLQSKEDEVDVAVERQWQQPVDSARWRLAQADADASYSRFAEAFGGEISADKSPLLVHLIDRAQADVSMALGEAKRYYNRPRPYQRFQFDHVCGFATAPAPDASLKGGNSYPSGHSAFGWTTAQVLAAVAPERAQIILARGREYDESRIVCAVHYPSDVMGGEVLSAAVLGKISTQSEFKRDLSCAQQEHAVNMKTSNQLSSECLALKKQVVSSLNNQNSH
jgi:acid phosphatase (class A)